MPPSVFCYVIYKAVPLHSVEIISSQSQTGYNIQLRLSALSRVMIISV